MKKVYLNDHICESAVARLEASVELVSTYDHPEELDAIIVRQQFCPREVIEKASKCKLIQMHGAGLERIDLEAAKEYNIPVKNVPDGNSRSVAELAVAMFLALSRKLKFIDTGLQAGKFDRFGLPETEGNELAGKTLGLVGGGRIAQLTAGIMTAAFQTSVLCYDPFLDAEKCASLGFTKVETLEELVKKSDLITIHVPFLESTRHMFNAEIFDKANPNLILVNTARGGIVDEDALYEALVNGKIRAAGMDVFEQQPPKTDNPLLGLDNFVATLHIGGSTKEAMERVGNRAVDNVFEALGIVG